MAKILCALPRRDFDPTETGVPWLVLTQAKHQIVFATPNGKTGEADPIMVTGQGLGLFKSFMMADSTGLSAYNEMLKSDAFQNPIKYSDIKAEEYDAIILPGGHAKGMREYLESNEIKRAIVFFFENNKPVGAICHGTLVVARSISTRTGKSVLYEKNSTGLTFVQEMIAWNLTRLWMGDYYRTYPVPMETELRSFLKLKSQFIRGPMPIFRDNPENLKHGYTVLDGNYLSARWPGDAHKFSQDFSTLISRYWKIANA